MQLFQRVKLLAKNKAGSAKSLGEALGLSQSRFNGYLNETRQNNLWPLLPSILELYPDVSRDWLYFGEGEMIAAANPTPEQFSELQHENQQLREELEALKKELSETNRLYKNVSARLILGDSTEDSAASSAKIAGGQK